MDPVTRNKIKFIDDSSAKSNSPDVVNMEECIDSNQIESSLGGKYNFDFDISTYWKALLEKTDKAVFQY